MFDPFRDFAMVGYLRNVEGLKELEEIKRQEHFFFESNLELALEFLHARHGPLGYEDLLEVHRILFQEFYPWAGKDRHMLGVGRLVGKGDGIQFEAAEMCRRAVEWGLELGNDKARIRSRPGEVMGAFAWGHPFLDGNGRAMLLVHSELCHRAGFSIDWTSSNKNDYLAALGHELKNPNDRRLDQYLSGLTRPAKPHANWVEEFKAMRGLDGLDFHHENVSYRDDDPVANARYEEIKRGRGNGPDDTA